MEYLENDSDLRRYYGLSKDDSSDVYSWQFIEEECVELCVAEEGILRITSDEFFSLCVQLTLNNAIEHHMNLHDILEKKYGIHCTTITQFNMIENDTWLCVGVVAARRSQLEELLSIMFLLPYNSFAICSDISLKKESFCFFNRGYINSPMSLVCAAIINNGYGVIHVIRGSDGTSINYITENSKESEGMCPHTTIT